MKFNIIEYEKINELVYTYSNKSGLTLYYIPRKGYVQKTAALISYFGSTDEEFKLLSNNQVYSLPLGVAHFLEHKLFEQEEGNVMDQFAILGADVNAYTTYNHTGYSFSCIENFYDSLKLLINFVFHPHFTSDGIEREKSIIEQEICMNFDEPDWLVDYNMLQGLYFNNSIKNDIVGTIESISQINKEILYFVHKIFYNAQNMNLLVIGDVDIEKIIEIIDENVPSIESLPFMSLYPDEPLHVKKSIIKQNFDIQTPLFSLSIKENNLLTNGLQGAINEMAVNTVMEMIIGESTDFYEKLYFENIINNTYNFEYEIGKTYSYSNINSESINPMLFRDLLIEQINFIKKHGLNLDDFKRIKNARIGRNIQSLDSISVLSDIFLPEFKEGICYFDYCSISGKITFEFINEIFNQHFNPDNIVLSILDPY